MLKERCILLEQNRAQPVVQPPGTFFPDNPSESVEETNPKSWLRDQADAHSLEGTEDEVAGYLGNRR